MTIENQVVTEEKEVKKQVITLNFDCYEFFKFIETISKYVDEIELIFEGRELTISFSDASKIMLSKCTHLVDNNFTIMEKMVFGIDTTDLVKLLRCRKTDKKEIELIFDNTKTFIQLTKTSEKYHSDIERTLTLIDLDIEVPSTENLNKIEYPAKVSFNTKYLNDFFYEASIFSEIVEIEINENTGISFSEEGQIGTSKYQIKSEYTTEIKGFEKGNYAYSFLTPIKPLLPILTNSDITFHIKHDYPIKLELRIESLDIDMVVYLAPRVEEADYDDYDDDDEF